MNDCKGKLNEVRLEITDRIEAFPTLYLSNAVKISLRDSSDINVVAGSNSWGTMLLTISERDGSPLFEQITTSFLNLDANTPASMQNKSMASHKIWNIARILGYNAISLLQNGQSWSNKLAACAGE